MENILSLVGQYGYLVISFEVMLESAGGPLSGETILVASGVLVHREVLEPGDAVLFGTLGAMVGDQIGYWVGRAPIRNEVGPLSPHIPQASRARGGVLRPPRDQGGLSGPLRRGLEDLRSPGRRDEPHALEDLPPLNALGSAVWATAAVSLGLLPVASLGLVEYWLGRASLSLVVLVALALALYRSYRRFGPSKPARGTSDEEGRRPAGRKTASGPGCGT